MVIKMVDYNNILKKVRNYTLAFALAAAPLTNCMPQSITESPQERERTHSTITYEDLEKLSLSVNQIDRLAFLPENYLTRSTTEFDLKILAAVKEGTANINDNAYMHTTGIPGGPILDYSHDTFIDVLKRADYDGDKVITPAEARKLRREMYEEITLGVDRDKVVDLGGGYVTSNDLVDKIRLLAGVRTGSVVPIKNNSIITYNKNPDPIITLDSYVRTIKGADENNDKVITKSELEDLSEFYHDVYNRVIERLNR
jgi:hypothetical protein